MQNATGGNFNRPLQNDNVFIDNEVVSLAALTKTSVRKGLEKAIISGGSIVNVVSDKYGHLPNESFFLKVEEKLIDADVHYVTRSINRDNRSFAVDYILSDESYHINVKTGKADDIIKPMLRFVNSYDGSNKTSGHFGFFRHVCSNGLHVAQQKIGFSVKHRGNIAEAVIPEIKSLIGVFMDNEFYSLHKKFEVLAERPLTDLHDFVKFTADSLGLFKYESSDKNPEPSLNARMVLDIISNEAQMLGTTPNLWLGYNAFNEVLHGKLKKTFEQQKTLDAKIFDAVLEYQN